VGDRYESRFDVWGKVDNEGGIYDAIVNYGIKAADMPAGDTELERAWRELEDAFQTLQPLVNHIESMLNDAYDAATDNDKEP
jgi:hypothetical protein